MRWFIFIIYSSIFNGYSSDKFPEVINNPIIARNIFKYLPFDAISNFKKSVCNDSELKNVSSFIDEMGLHVIRPIENKVWNRNYAYESYLNDEGSWQVRGTPQAGMKSYSTDRDFNIDKVISYTEGENEGEPWVMFGKLKDGSCFHFTASCDYTGFECQGGGVITYSKDWEDLLNNVSDRSLAKLVNKLNTSEEFIELLNKHLSNVKLVKKYLMKGLNKI